jgi:type 1 glutamine amidotransferase
LRPRKLLLLNVNVNDSGRRPDVHTSLPYGNYAIEEMGQRTGAYATAISTDIEALRPQNLEQYDAICFNNTTGVLTTDPVLRQSLLSFVAKGKGLVAFHAGDGLGQPSDQVSGDRPLASVAAGQYAGQAVQVGAGRRRLDGGHSPGQQRSYHAREDVAASRRG